MKNVRILDDSANNPSMDCQFEIATLGTPTIGQASYAEHVLERLAAMAEEELGDVLPASALSFSNECRAGNEMWKKLSNQTAHEIAMGAMNCFQQRYLGNCAVRQCSNRDNMTKKLKELMERSNG